MKKSNILFTFISLRGLSYLSSTKIEPTTNEILFKPLGNLIPELSWATIRIKINITDMFKETEELCRAANIMEKEYTRMGDKYTGGKIKIKVSPTNLNNIQAHLAEILAEDIRQMCVQNTIRIQEIIDVYNLKKSYNAHQYSRNPPNIN